jgi:hypothetical protein
MLKPHSNESLNDYMDRSVKKLIEEGSTQLEAVAISHSNYEKETTNKTYTNLSRYLQNK